ncbi:MAG: GlsB/YeaQ/YmgE family stress response membrane protein [Planctomycetota bacterium]
MTLIELLILLCVAGVCGALGQALTGVSRGGCCLSVVLGFVGALLGSWLSRVLKLPELLMLEFGDTHFPVVWAIVGSALFVGVLSLFTRRRVVVRE